MNLAVLDVVVVSIKTIVLFRQRWMGQEKKKKVDDDHDLE